MALLEVQGLAKTYGRRRVVDGVDFAVNQGQVVGLLGPNGAGKTTSFRMACGLIEPDEGKVLLGDIDVTNWPMYRRAKDGGMGYLAQESSIFRKLTVEQNLLGMMELLGMGRRERRERCAELLDQFQITKLRKSLASKVSGGERRRLEIARCLISKPKIILLDEPFAGIDPVTVQSIQKIIRKLQREQGISILITDHAAWEILEIVDYCYVINDGKVFFQGTSTQVRNHPKVRETYLGRERRDDGSPPPRPHERRASSGRETATSHLDDDFDSDDSYRNGDL